MTEDSPAARMRAATARHGSAAVARDACVALSGGAVDDEVLLTLGGPHARMMLERGDKPYWPRVWGARALLYVWEPAAASAVVQALHDEHWRVREMAAKVCLRRELGSALESLEALASDPVPRVRVAAARALGALGEGEHAPVLQALSEDDDVAVRSAASRALEVLSRRLDRDFP